MMYRFVAGLIRVRKPGLVAASAIKKIVPSSTPFSMLLVDPVVPCGAATRADQGCTPRTSRHHNTIQSQLGSSRSGEVVPGTGGAVRVMADPSAGVRGGFVAPRPEREVEGDAERLVVLRRAR